MQRRVFLAASLWPAWVRGEESAWVRGRLMEGLRLVTEEGRRVELGGDEGTVGVLRDGRLRVEEFEAQGTFEGADRFRILPIYERAMFVRRNGKRLVITYWCEVCSIRSYSPGLCVCCQQETKLDPRDPALKDTDPTPANPSAAYTVERSEADGVAVITLRDTRREMEVTIAPGLGNNVREFKVKGQRVLWMPAGNPFLWPWANRLESETYWVNGREHRLNRALNNYGRDGHGLPIHGLVMKAKEWEVLEAAAGGGGAAVRSRLEFWRNAQWMEQFPFAHTVEMTYRLRDGALEVETAVENRAQEPLPVALGFHPYFQLTDAPRDDWTVHLAAKERVVLSDKMIPTGERRALTESDPFALKGVALDDVFTALVRDADGMARFWVQGKKQRVTVEYGPKYRAAVVYAPPGRGFICFEPMTAITNTFNAAQRGEYKELQSIAPGGTWRERYAIRPSGF